MPNFVSLPGFRDFYPDEMAVRTYIVGVWREVARRYGFQEYDGPPLESTELYIEKSGPDAFMEMDFLSLTFEGGIQSMEFH